MAYRKRHVFKPRRRFKKHGTTKRNYQFKRRSNYRSGNAFNTKRWVYQKVVLLGDNVANYGWGQITFALSEVPNYSEFTALFERYRLTGVALRYRLTRTDDSTASLKGYIPTLVAVKDYDDSSTPTSFNELCQYPQAKTMVFASDKTYYRQFIRPACQTATYRTALSTGYSPSWTTWIATVNPDVPHYGMKYAWEKLYQGHQLEIECCYYLRFRGTK